MKNIRLAVMASGRGSNLSAILEASSKKSINADVIIVISDKETAYALQIAEKNGIKTFFADPKQYKTRQEHETQISKFIKDNNIDLIVLAGYMRVLTDYFVSQFKGKLINIHPSLLPSFKGGHAQKDAVEYGAKISGCTVHFVDEGVDSGPIITQTSVPILDDDTPETLSARIIKEEHKALPAVIQLFAENRLKIEGRKVKINPAAV
jgi:phosphoribosylglycinamide formyltransferase-1